MKKEKKLEILVVEDKPEHRKAAERMLIEKGHSVDIAQDYSEAIEMLGYEMIPGAEKKTKKYDVVLTDLMMPAGESFHTGMTIKQEEREKESPLGYGIALYAVLKEVPLIGIVTDMNHHSSAIALTFDLLRQKEGKFVKTQYGRKAVIDMDKSKFIALDERDTGYQRIEAEPSPWSDERETIKVKDWANALDIVLKAYE